MPRATAQVLLGDCLEHLRQLEDRSVDALIMDPPYCSGGISEAGKMRAPAQGISAKSRRQQGWFVGDNMTTQGLVWLLRAVAFESERVLVRGGSLLVFLDWRMWSSLAPALESGGLRLQGMVVWDKGSAGLGTGFRPTHELVAVLTNGSGRFYSKCGSNVLRIPRVWGGHKEHPTQKPVELLRQLIKVATPAGGLVVDPFAGSGSTGVAALLEGRRFLGIEREPHYVEVARERLAEAVADARAGGRAA